MIYQSAQLDAMEQRYRAAFVNSLSGFKAANLVGSCDADGQYNLAIMSSVVHIGSHPPLLALVLRPDDAKQHSLQNILSQKHYTLNHVSEDIFKAAHQTAARYPKEISEFDAVGLDTQQLADFPAPFVKAAVVKLGMLLRDHKKLEINGTHLIIGEIVLACVPDSIIGDDGSVDIGAANTVTLSGLDSYYSTSRLARMPYAKP
ncbi:MAG: flavin reductase family protein [Gammaproteobacteria bacterium]|nr:flavin reductase family protein [Gammaproteobacteria bacterium]NND38513.1 flavin reductase [Pseudomonadales bacterium]MBT8150516.1 flavin reductase family protein [Gammaproteobacteria bacterium]NNL10999.1 flavin reductase [Pseudomonadales bacterium]NNM11900.1 flavin reductase [Pseudomonadales bacterium]